MKLIFKNYQKLISSVGIDLGIKDMAILSTGEKIENLKFRKQLEDKLKREQRKLSKRFLVAKKSNKKWLCHNKWLIFDEKYRIIIVRNSTTEGGNWICLLSKTH